MFNEFLQQTCNIYSVAIATVWWEQTKTETKIYSEIRCKLYQKKKFSLPETNLAQETDTSSYSIIIEWDKTEVNEWNIIEIIDWRWKNIGKFLVHSVAFYKNIVGKADHLNLSVAKI